MNRVLMLERAGRRNPHLLLNNNSSYSGNRR